MSLSGYRSESSIQSYSKMDESTKKRMSETLTAAAVSEVSAVSSESQLAERHVPVSPILSLTQEEHIMRNVHLSSHSQVKKQYTFHNCNVIFNYTLCDQTLSLIEFSDCIQLYISVRSVGKCVLRDSAFI